MAIFISSLLLFGPLRGRSRDYNSIRRYENHPLNEYLSLICTKVHDYELYAFRYEFCKSNLLPTPIYYYRRRCLIGAIVCFRRFSNASTFFMRWSKFDVFLYGPYRRLGIGLRRAISGDTPGICRSYTICHLVEALSPRFGAVWLEFPPGVTRVRVIRFPTLGDVFQLIVSEFPFFVRVVAAPLFSGGA